MKLEAETLEAEQQPSPLAKGVAFLQRQQRDWRVTVARTSLDKFLYQMAYPYISVYIVALGASASGLGVAMSIGMLLAAFASPFVGWLIDHNGPKRLYLFGIATLGTSYLLYAVAPDWRVSIMAMAAFWLGNTLSVQSCATVCGNCLANRDRATGMMICESVAAGLLGMVGPILSAVIVHNFGGVNPAGIRPVFAVCVLGTLLSFVLVRTQLSDRRWGMGRRAAPNIAHDLVEVLREGRHLKRWLLIASVSQLPLGMVFPFATVFAHELKGADELVLGGMVTATALTSILFGIPFGRLADRLGRKRLLFVAAPLFWLSIPVLVWAPNPAFVIVAGALQGFQYIAMPITAAMERELVPAEQMGRWLGIGRFFKLSTLALLTFVSGLVWDQAGPAFVFFGYVALDIFLRMPLLLGMPETLGMRVKRVAGVG